MFSLFLAIVLAEVCCGFYIWVSMLEQSYFETNLFWDAILLYMAAEHASVVPWCDTITIDSIVVLSIKMVSFEDNDIVSFLLLRKWPSRKTWDDQDSSVRIEYLGGTFQQQTYFQAIESITYALWSAQLSLPRSLQCQVATVRNPGL